MAKRQLNFSSPSPSPSLCDQHRDDKQHDDDVAVGIKSVGQLNFCSPPFPSPSDRENDVQVVRIKSSNQSIADDDDHDHFDSSSIHKSRLITKLNLEMPSPTQTPQTPALRLLDVHSDSDSTLPAPSSSQTQITKPPPPTCHSDDEPQTDQPPSKRPAAEKASDKLSSKKPKLNLLPFQKIWSQEDEISLLTSAMEFIDGAGVQPADDSAAFYQFAIPSLTTPEFSSTQVSTKLRKLRDKHSKNALKDIKGKNIVFPDAHAEKVYELSKCVWGGSKSEAEKEKIGLAPTRSGLRQSKKHQVENVNKEKAKPGLGFSLLCDRPLSEDAFVDNGFTSLEDVERRKFEKRWEGLTILQLELNLEKTKLIMDQKKALLKAVNRKLRLMKS